MTTIFANQDFSIDPFLQYGSFGLLAFIVFWAIWKFLPAMTEKHFQTIDRLATEHSASIKAMLEEFKEESRDCREERIKDREMAAQERIRDQQARHEALNKVAASNAELHKIISDLQRAVLDLQARK